MTSTVYCKDSKVTSCRIGYSQMFKPVLNLLVLGEAGVGKSTWINSLLNSLLYEDLEAAIAGGIHSSNTYNFFVGHISRNNSSSAHKVCEPDPSNTECTKVSEFETRELILKIIDTPGIGDTRGIEQDDKNFQGILREIRNVQNLHAICILVYPGMTILSIEFRRLLLKLFSNFDRDAIKNIFFCFTKTREYFYEPGVTFPTLKSFLQEHKANHISLSDDRIYCFENEAYKFLAAAKNNQTSTLPKDRQLIYGESWKQCVSETRRLLATIKRVSPHRMVFTNYLQDVRASMHVFMTSISNPSNQCYPGEKYTDWIGSDEVDMSIIVLGSKKPDCQMCLTKLTEVVDICIKLSLVVESKLLTNYRDEFKCFLDSQIQYIKHTNSERSIGLLRILNDIRHSYLHKHPFYSLRLPTAEIKVNFPKNQEETNTLACEIDV